MNLSPSAPGLPATPFKDPPGRKVLVLSGTYAQHVARIIRTLPSGGAQVVIIYGHSQNAGGKFVCLPSGAYVLANSPTCPALPKRPQTVEVPALAAG